MFLFLLSRDTKISSHLRMKSHGCHSCIIFATRNRRPFSKYSKNSRNAPSCTFTRKGTRYKQSEWTADRNIKPPSRDSSSKRELIAILRLTTPLSPMAFRNVSIELSSIWPAPCCSERICQTNSGQKQSQPLSTSRIGSLTPAFVGISLRMKCGLERSHPCLIFVFSAVLLTPIFPKNVVRNMAMERSTIALFIPTLLGTTSRILFTKSGTRQITPSFAQGMLFSTKLYITRMKVISTILLPSSSHWNSKAQQHPVFQYLFQLNHLNIYPNALLRRFYLQRQPVQPIGLFHRLRSPNLGTLHPYQFKGRPLRKSCRPIPSGVKASPKTPKLYCHMSENTPYLTISATSRDPLIAISG